MFRLRLDPSLELRVLEPAQADTVYRAVDRNRAHIRQWLPWVDGSKSPTDISSHIGEVFPMYTKGEALPAGIWIDGDFRGAISLHKIDRLNRMTSIGYWLDSEFQGRGIMKRCCRAMVDEGFRRFDLNRIQIRCATGNHRSCAIPESLGFTREGVLREAEWLYDHFVDLVVYGMLAREWSTRKS